MTGWSRWIMMEPAHAGAVQKSANGRRHYPELDALRGAAAMVVLFTHFYQVWLTTHHPHWASRPKLIPPLWLLTDGHASVILFFLLSGFVLTLPSLRGSKQPYARYITRRICRIYPPYLAGLMLSIVGCSYFWGHTQYGQEFAQFWSAPPDVHAFLAHLRMIGRFDVYRYDPPVWSLVHEMRISIVFPLILLVSRRLRAWSVLGVAALCTVLSSLSLKYVETGLPSAVSVTAWSLTLSYCGTFLLGSALAHRREQLVQALGKARLTTRLGLLALGFALYLYPVQSVYGIAVGDFVTSCGGLLLLTYCLQHGGGVTHWLRTAPMQFLGRISYSIYLVHLPVLLVLAYLLYGHNPVWFLLPFLLISLLLATGVYYSVEVPSIALGRVLGAMQPGTSWTGWFAARHATHVRRATES